MFKLESTRKCSKTAGVTQNPQPCLRTAPGTPSFKDSSFTTEPRPSDTARVPAILFMCMGFQWGRRAGSGLVPCLGHL